MRNPADRFMAAIVAVVLTLWAGVLIAATPVGECGPGPAASPGDAQQALFRIDGESHSEAGLPMALRQALYDVRLEHHKKQLELIDAAVLDLALERSARQAGKSRPALESELFAVAPPDEGAIEAFYRQNQARIPYPIEAVRDRIRQILVQRAVQARQVDFIARTKREQSFEVALTRPVAPYAEIATAGFPTKGAPDAKVTIVEFADYQCPHCKSAADALKRVVAGYDGDVRVVFLDFPVNPSGISRVVAEGAACADRQGRFWAYHDLAFARQAGLRRESAAELAADLKLDAEAFQACMDSAFARERVAKSEAEARRLGLRSTPTLFLNGRRLHLHDIDSELPGEIDRALAQTSGS